MKNYKEVINYLIFGVLTTMVNIVSYVILTKLLNVDYKIATTIAWLISVLFAFITNKIYVFNSKEYELKHLSRELLSFILFRLLSYLVDIAIMIIMVEWMEANDLFAKIVANIIVVIINYIASKYVIFSMARKNYE